MTVDLRHWSAKANSFAADAHSILGHHEAATQSRTLLISQTYDKLDDLSIDQKDMLSQSVRCISMEVYRAAFVLAWAALADYMQKSIMQPSLQLVLAARPNWQATTLDDIVDQFGEHQQILACNAAGLIKKSEKKTLEGLLHRRNMCAHPSSYYPGANEALGYLSEIHAFIKHHA